jgi:tRNA threonylcarbamoyladenosine biosynthesis protein TsaE
MTLISESVVDTERIAAELAGRLRGGEVIALVGELGAGKTQFVRGLVGALGGKRHAVSSPTFVLLHIYDTGRLRVHHLDAYRISGAADFEAIGFSELLDDPNAVTVVEWADRVASLLPETAIRVRISETAENDRRIEIC